MPKALILSENISLPSVERSSRSSSARVPFMSLPAPLTLARRYAIIRTAFLLAGYFFSADIAAGV